MTPQDTKPGNFIMMGLPGTELDKETISFIREFGLSNFILFSRNARLGPAALKRLCADIRSACLEEGIKVPIIAVDQEGGRVQRLHPPLWPYIPSNTETGACDDPSSGVEKQAKLAFEALSPFGINMNLAPVLDVALPDEKGALKGRTYGDSPEIVAELGLIYIAALEKRGIAACAKHFPGIGLAKKDPHFERPVVQCSMKTIERHLFPFEMAIKNKVSSVMTSHVVFDALDPTMPATFSYIIANRLLRDELGFQGTLLSDDLEMGGITEYEDMAKASVKAFIAGHDILLVCHSQARGRRAMEALKKAFDDGTIPKKRWDESLKRIKRLQSQLTVSATHIDSIP